MSCWKDQTRHIKSKSIWESVFQVIRHLLCWFPSNVEPNYTYHPSAIITVALSWKWEGAPCCVENMTKIVNTGKRVGGGTESNRPCETWSHKWNTNEVCAFENIKRLWSLCSSTETYFINLAGGVKKCELWECLSPSGRTYEYSGEMAEEQHSIILRRLF